MRFAWLPLPERRFLAFAIVCLIVTRLAVILATPRTADFLDPRIYQGAGQTVLAGVNPYDFTDQPAVREKLRARMAAPGTADFTGTQRAWDYYVSGNPPLSTALYAVFEALAHGSRTVWRLLLIFGDLALLLGQFALLKTLRGRVDGALDQAGTLSLSVFNPILVLSGCAIPEDKQFETALMLYAAALLLSPAASTAGRSLWSGIVLSLSVFFKVLGVFLAPLWLARLRRAGWRFGLCSILGALLPALLSWAAFGRYFVGALAARGVQNSVLGPEHASPWVLLPLTGDGYVAAKTVAVGLMCVAVGVLFVKRRIDVLNVCAGVAVAFTCLWLDKGAMTRMNIAIVFAVASLASLSGALFAWFAFALAALSAVGYLLGLGVLRLHLESVDALLALIFVLAYVATLLVFTDRARAQGRWAREPLSS